MKRNTTSITLDDVAKAAGLSRAQVSRALRGDPGVRDETRRAAREAAGRLGYVPNLAARSLASAGTQNIGILIGEPHNPFQLKLANAIDNVLAEAGLEATLSLRAQTDISAEREAERMRGMRVSGLILIAIPRAPEAVRRIAGHVPTVYVGGAVTGPRLSAIWPDSEGGARRAVQHLLDRGHRRIAHIGGGDNPGAAERLAGYLGAMQDAGLVPQVVPGNHDFRSGRAATEVLFDAPHPPTAIFAGNDFSAIGTMSRLHEMGLRVPQDVSVVGFDDIAFADSTHFGLTTIGQQTERQAELAVTALRRLTADPQAQGESHMIPVTLLQRRTVGPCPPDKGDRKGET